MSPVAPPIRDDHKENHQRLPGASTAMKVEVAGDVTASKTMNADVGESSSAFSSEASGSDSSSSGDSGNDSDSDSNSESEEESMDNMQEERLAVSKSVPSSSETTWGASVPVTLNQASPMHQDSWGTHDVFDAFMNPLSPSNTDVNDSDNLSPSGTYDESVFSDTGWNESVAPGVHSFDFTKADEKNITGVMNHQHRENLSTVEKSSYYIGSGSDTGSVGRDYGADNEVSNETSISLISRVRPVVKTTINNEDLLQQSIMTALQGNTASARDDAVAIGIGAGIAAAMGIATSHLCEEDMSTDDFDDTEADSFDTPDFTSNDGMSVHSASDSESSQSESSRSIEMAGGPPKNSIMQWESSALQDDKDAKKLAEMINEEEQRISSKEARLLAQMIEVQEQIRKEKSVGAEGMLALRKDVPLTLGHLMRSESVKNCTRGGTIVSVTDSTSSDFANAQWAAIAESNYRAPSRPVSFRGIPDKSDWAINRTISSINRMDEEGRLSSTDSESYLGSLRSGGETLDKSQTSCISAFPDVSAPSTFNGQLFEAMDSAVAVSGYDRATNQEVYPLEGPTMRAKATLRNAHSQNSLMQRQLSMVSISEGPSNDESSSSGNYSSDSGSYESESDTESE